MAKPAPRKSYSVNKIFLFLLFLSGLAAGVLVHKFYLRSKPREQMFSLKRRYTGGTHLVNPLMQVEGPSDTDAELVGIKKRIKEYTDQCLRDKKIYDVSVYLRDLNSGGWVGINEDEKYVGASLGKVPILFSFYVAAQSKPAIFDKEVLYDAPVLGFGKQIIAPKNELEPGKTYTVRELVRHMIVYSDNTSLGLLANDQDIDSTLINRLYEDLGLPAHPHLKDYYISAKDYAGFFRLLYSATYLSDDSSEEALTLLTQTDFKEGIVAGVPENLMVAHKFAEREKDAYETELHDCGIVYYPTDPYLVCIMTRGRNLAALKEVMQTISKITYREWDRLKK